MEALIHSFIQKWLTVIDNHKNGYDYVYDGVIDYRFREDLGKLVVKSPTFQVDIYYLYQFTNFASTVNNYYSMLQLLVSMWEQSPFILKLLTINIQPKY